MSMIENVIEEQNPQVTAQNQQSGQTATQTANSTGGVQASVIEVEKTDAMFWLLVAQTALLAYIAYELANS